MNYDTELNTLGGDRQSLSRYRGQALLIVNVASRCGFTPQYASLESLHRKYSARGFSVLGVPCNQFGAQEPGTADEIREFCSARYEVTFPLSEKIEVNGPGRHPLYADLTGVADETGLAGPVQWNFEKFLVSATGEVTRFRSAVKPDDPKLIAAIEASLPSNSPQTSQ